MKVIAVESPSPQTALMISAVFLFGVLPIEETRLLVLLHPYEATPNVPVI